MCRGMSGLICTLQGLLPEISPKPPLPVAQSPDVTQGLAVVALFLAGPIAKLKKTVLKPDQLG
jgi:hypothetical protein